jgi:RNA polymerase sigma-70 factor (ECF subfamily)
MKSDLELVHLLKEGDEEAFEVIFHSYFEKLCLFSESITKNHYAAEEIVEELLLQLWLNCRINPVEKSIKSYLYQSTYNNSIKYISRHRKDSVRIGGTEYDGSNEELLNLQTLDYSVSNLVSKELEARAVAVVQSLPDQCREIYLLNRDQDMKYHEIAEKLHITVGTVKKQMSRAYSRLRKELKEYLYIFL